MSEEQRPNLEFRAELRRHPAFQTALVFGGGSWLALLQVARRDADAEGQAQVQSARLALQRLGGADRAR